MTRWRRWTGLLAVGLALLLAVLLVAVRLRYGGGARFPDRSGEPLLPGSVLEVVAELPLPPGNIAVSETGRVFFSFHPEAGPELSVVEWVDGHAVAFPSADVPYQNVLGIRIDGAGRLWVLDNGNHGLGQPRLLAFDLETGEEVHRFDFPSEVAAFGSHLNDLQVDPSGRWVYIADASIVARRPALVLYDVQERRARRLLEDHPSVEAEPFVPVVQGRKMVIFGLVSIRPGVDSIALDRKGEWLYFAPVTNEHLYRVRASDLRDERLSAPELESRVERWALKTMSDGITTDRAGNVYLTDLEHDAIVRLDPDGKLATLVRDRRLRWPDGLSFGPGAWLYVTCSSLQDVIGRSAAHVRSQAPYQIFRFRPGGDAKAGH